MRGLINNILRPKKLKGRKGQALVEYALLTSITVIIGISLSYFYSQDYWQKVYKEYTNVISQPIPMD